MPPTQIGRALRELGIGWIAAHSPQAKGRIERSFGTAQDRLVKGLRVAGAQDARGSQPLPGTKSFMPWWNQHLVVVPANATDAHRPLGQEHDLAAALSQVETRQVANDYTIRCRRQDRTRSRAPAFVAGLRGANVRVEWRLDGSLAVRFRETMLELQRMRDCPLRQATGPSRCCTMPRKQRPKNSAADQTWDKIDLRNGLPVWHRRPNRVSQPTQ